MEADPAPYAHLCDGRILATLLVIAYLLTRLHRVRGQLSLIKDALMDIKSGNLNRRVLVRESDMTKQICYDINEIAMSSQSRLIQQKQSEQAYKRLMTSLSHDVKTPLASLVGYLEAVESKMVTGAEQEEYIRVAAEKAHHLKEFVTVLFEWVKLDAGEQIFHFELCDLNELSRNIMADWVPLLESHDLTYEIEIPETEYMTRVDSTAYTRILNNLLQNILTHSVASQVSLTVTETEQQAKIVVADNGKGISISDLPHIFERMYQCDHSRAAKGNGLGLSIAKELVSVHKGTITAASIPGAGTTFTIMLPKAL
jgi:signal transduction histidine kinase